MTILVICSVLFSCAERKTFDFPKPYDPDAYLLQLEDGKDKSVKKRWLENIHRCPDNLNWKTIEHIRRLEKSTSITNNGVPDLRNSYTSIGNNDQIIGKWSERGSTNQAGSIINSTYHSETQTIYLIADGGSLWLGSEDGLWTLANQSLQFDGILLSIGKRTNGDKILALTINGIPHYSDIGGLEVFRSSGYQIGQKNTIVDAVSINDGKDIFILTQRNDGNHLELFHSSNYGVKYSKLKDFEGTNPLNFVMRTVPSLNDVYIIEGYEDERSRLFKWDTNTKKFALILANMQIGFGPNGIANLEISDFNNSNVFYVYDVFKNFYKSSNEGLNWEYLSELPASPWAAGIQISKSNPDLMLLSEVDLHRSLDGGYSWNRVNFFWEYYFDPLTKLHADIMDVSEYRRSNLSYFSLIANHGGISISENFGLNNINIGLSGLNVSQYYDCKTYSFDPNYIFAGSQDQGFQIAYDIEEQILEFDQIWAGDFDHITFTGNDLKHAWVVYPHGEVFFFEDPLSGKQPIRYNGLVKKHRNIWMPQIISNDESKDEVYLVGGNIDGGSGSYIIKLSLNDTKDKILSQQLPFDFAISGSELASLAINEFDPSIWYATTTNGKFYISNDSGNYFVESSFGIPQSQYLFPTKILPSKIDPDVIYVAGSGYANSAVSVSYDGGNLFYPLDNKLPKTAGLDLALSENEDFLFMASEAGPYVYIFEEASWFAMDGDIAPDVRYWSVEYDSKAKRIRFGTYGRGIWDFNISNSTSTDEQSLTNSDIKIYPNPVTEFLTIDLGIHKFENLKYSIIDCSGTKIKSSFLKANENIINCSNLSSGMYIIYFENENNYFSKSFIKI